MIVGCESSKLNILAQKLARNKYYRENIEEVRKNREYYKASAEEIPTKKKDYYQRKQREN